MIYDALQKLPRFILGSHPSDPSTPLFRWASSPVMTRNSFLRELCHDANHNGYNLGTIATPTKFQNSWMHCLQKKKKGGQKNIEFKEKRIQSPKKKSETKEQKKNIVFMQQYLKIGLLSLELFTSQKHQNIGSPERISQRKLPGSIH